MTWSKIDDQFHAHPKVVQAWHTDPRALGLHVLALSHCAAYLTDGHVSEAWVRTQIPAAGGRRRTVQALLEAGLWEQNGAGWLVHDYLDFNESRETVLARRRSDSKRKLNGPHARVRAGARVPAPTPDLFPS